MIDMGRFVAPKDQSPVFKLIATHSAKAVDRMFSVTFGRLVHSDTEIVPALGAFSSDVLGMMLESYRRGGSASISAIRFHSPWLAISLLLFADALTLSHIQIDRDAITSPSKFLR